MIYLYYLRGVEEENTNIKKKKPGKLDYSKITIPVVGI